MLRQIKPDLADDQSVCGGDLTGMPKVGLSYDECAEACDNEVRATFFRVEAFYSVVKVWNCCGASESASLILYCA